MRDPVCGMALEPMEFPTGDEGPTPEPADFTRCFRIESALTLPVLILAMVGASEAERALV